MRLVVVLPKGEQGRRFEEVSKLIRTFTWASSPQLANDNGLFSLPKLSWTVSDEGRLILFDDDFYGKIPQHITFDEPISADEFHEAFNLIGWPDRDIFLMHLARLYPKRSLPPDITFLGDITSQIRQRYGPGSEAMNQLLSGNEEANCRHPPFLTFRQLMTYHVRCINQWTERYDEFRMLRQNAANNRRADGHQTQGNHNQAQFYDANNSGNLPAKPVLQTKGKSTDETATVPNVDSEAPPLTTSATDTRRSQQRQRKRAAKRRAETQQRQLLDEHTRQIAELTARVQILEQETNVPTLKTEVTD